jgi:hypothetical protein
MKSVLLLIFAFSLTAFGEDPTLICESSECSKPMLKISAEYRNGHINFLKNPLSAFSGVCYHQDPNYDPEHAHYGVMVFQPSGATFQMTGFFGFFYDEDPYAHLSSREVLSDLLKNGYYPIKGQAGADSATIDLLFDTTEIKYWIRSDEKSEHLYLIGQSFGSGTSSWQTAVFCDLAAHN